MALNSEALVSLAELKAYLEAAGPTQDPNLEDAINGATAWLEGKVNRHLVTRGDVTELHTIPGGGAALQLSQPETIAVASVHESTQLPPLYDATTLLTADDDYALDREAGRIIRLSSGAPFPWATGYRAVQVVHSYGYRDRNGLPAPAKPIPEDIRRICLTVAAAMFQEGANQRWGTSSVTDAQGSVTRFTGYLPPSQMRALKSYRHYDFARTWVAA